jgi:hypothetical protein
MTVDSAIARFRRRQADLFRDEATVRRPTGTGTLSSTGDWTPATGTLVYDGPCLIRGQRWEATEVQVGGTEALLPHFTGKFPIDTDVVRNDIVTVTASTYDEGLVGKAFRVRDPHNDGWQISRWVILEEVDE